MIRPKSPKSQLAAQFDGILAWLVFGIPTFLLLSALWHAGTRTTVSVRQFEAQRVGEQLYIPKIIHQTYKTSNLPEAWKGTPEAWKQNHQGWRYEFWDDDRNRAFIQEHYPWFLEQFDSYPNNIQRADAIRYFILYHYGGVYADLDIQPMRNIELMLLGAKVVLPETPNVGLTNAFMASIPQSDFMKFVTEQLTPYANRWYHITRHWQIITSTGPTFIWRLGKTYSGPEHITRVPASVWGKCSICESRCPPVNDAFLRHLHGDSWHSWDSTLFTYVIFCHQYNVIFFACLVALIVALRGQTFQWLLAHRLIAIYSLGCFLILSFFQ